MSGARTSLDLEFFARTQPLTQVQIDWLIRRHGVPAMTLIRDGDGAGWPVCAARVERCGQRFEFREEDGTGAFIFLARDEDGAGTDIVAWEPRADWLAPWFGPLALLGQHEVLAPRLGEPLAVHRGPLGWLRGGRNGVVILNRSRARLLLEGVTLQAQDINHGLELRRALAPPDPKIVVLADADEKVAA